MTTYKRIEYRAQFSSLNLLQLRQLDKNIYQFHLRVSSNMNGFPYALLYGDSKFGGVGLKRLSDTITIDKLRNLYTCLQSDHFTASASNGLIARAARLQYGITRPDQYLRLESVTGATYYMKSILEWGKEMNYYLCRHGQSMPTRSTSNLYRSSRILLGHAGHGAKRCAQSNLLEPSI